LPIFELLWIARALQSGQNDGQLRGRRSVERWLAAHCRLADFAMSHEQFRRYRQIGTYGAYRVAFRSLPGLADDNGWTPGSKALPRHDLTRHRTDEGVWRQAWNAVLEDTGGRLRKPIIDWLCSAGVRHQVAGWLGAPSNTFEA